MPDPTLVTATGGPDDETAEAFAFVAERSGYAGGPWGSDPATDEPEEPSDA